MALLNFGLAMSLLGWGDVELYNVQCSILIIPVLYHVDASFTPPEVVTMCVSKLPNVLKEMGAKSFWVKNSWVKPNEALWELI